MKLGLYVHVPFCLQKCTYCDFATTAWQDEIAAQRYMDLIRRELLWAVQHFPTVELYSIYFGGGTPSLLPPSLISRFFKDLKDAGLSLQLLSEVTLEINPGTVTRENLKRLLDTGVNRFSVGVQTFQENLLKPLGREHSVAETFATLSLLKEHNLNFTLDLLYGLPNQQVSDLVKDIEITRKYEPPHVSTYNLTLPAKHPLQFGRSSDDTQVDMYFAILDGLGPIGLKPYEISNLAVSGFESKHNRIYWEDQAYWGLGMSSHSYNPAQGPWGTRFWNIYSSKGYTKWASELSIETPFETSYPDERREDLTKTQSITDFVHTSLRQMKGLSQSAFESKFGPGSLSPLNAGFDSLCEEGLMEASEKTFTLTPRGRMLLNTVLHRLFVESDAGAKPH